MSGFRDKLQVFFLGLMLGLLIGGGFFILKLDNYFKELSFYRSSQDEHEEKDVKEDEKIKKSKPKKNVHEVPVAATERSAKDSAMTSRKESRLKNDTLVFGNDSLAPIGKIADDNEIVVRKDEMTAAQTIEVINLSLTANAGKNSRDSLLQQVSGIREDVKTSMRVEFWRSPLNYRGYKMTRGKIVLYGISSADPVSVFKLDDDIYLKHLGLVYRLVFTNDFKQFEKVSDPAVLSRLNK